MAVLGDSFPFRSEEEGRGRKSYKKNARVVRTLFVAHILIVITSVEFTSAKHVQTQAADMGRWLSG